MKNILLPFCALACHTFLFAAEIVESKHTEKPTQNQQTVNHFLVLPEFTPAGYTNFVQLTYNHKDYATRFLASNIHYHLPHFYRFASKCPLPRTYIDATTSLFNQKLKASTYLNGYALCELLHALPEALHSFFDTDKEKQEQLNAIKKCVHDFLLEHFDDLKDQPDKALTDLSNTIYQSLRPSPEVDMPVSKLQQSMLLFLDHALHKVIWSPEDQIEVWTCVKRIAGNLEQLFEHTIIADTASLDELYWTLINRFSYFLDINGHDLHESCYQQISRDLMQEKLMLWELEEREPFITPKRKHLEDVVLQAEAIRRAYQAGIMRTVI